ncbi:MAG: DUF1343 domain-containing protein [Bacteroidales bacterium]|nr:DUF1343 domain-containing protein [Candidatus Cryptobacteroides choladohippi]MCQ2178608.1 DUF1343 domain-containing protein [Bacteroidales bacterium]
MLSCNNIRKFLCASALAVVSIVSSAGNVKPGIEVLRESGYAGLEGKRVGLVTNPSGVDRNLRSTVDILFNATEVNLVALYAPEHGIRGDIYAGGKVESGKDDATGLPVYSLYGDTRKPTQEMLKGIDIMVYDIQDVGSRSYTFISTLGLVMRACAEKGIPVMVLDRPNPLGGNKVEGPLVCDGFHSFVSQYKIPYIYGLTVGELAQLINEEGLNRGQKGNEPELKCKLYVVPMQGWERDMLFSDTGLPWILPSPNIPYAETAICYPSSGLCGEMYGYLNIGIGYTLPFATFAEEWVDADKLKARLDSYHVPGVAWRTIHYKPISGRLNGKMIHGVQYFYTDYDKATLTLTQFYVMQAVYELYGKNPIEMSTGRLAMFDKVCGTDYVRTEFGKRLKVSDIKDYWNKDAENFRKLSKKYYIY